MYDNEWPFEAMRIFGIKLWPALPTGPIGRLARSDQQTVTEEASMSESMYK